MEPKASYVDDDEIQPDVARDVPRQLGAVHASTATSGLTSYFGNGMGMQHGYR
jgi:hypothetical protein